MSGVRKATIIGNVILAVLLSGCGTLIGGRFQTIKITTEPDKAVATISNPCEPVTVINVTTLAEVKLKGDSFTTCVSERKVISR